MKITKGILLYILTTVVYLLIIPEIIFRLLSEQHLLLLGKVVNPLNLFGSTVDALIIATIILSLVLSWLTVYGLRKVFAGKPKH